MAAKTVQIPESLRRVKLRDVAPNLIQPVRLVRAECRAHEDRHAALSPTVVRIEFFAGDPRLVRNELFGLVLSGLFIVQ